ncbi:hypothetical protein X801_02401, partial [Opisthorchis viverrini]
MVSKLDKLALSAEMIVEILQKMPSDPNESSDGDTSHLILSTHVGDEDATCLPTSELLKRFSKEELEAKMKIIKDAYEKILDNRMQELNAFYQLHGRP